MPCIMPEMPYCPAYQFGQISCPDWAEICDQIHECNWECLCTDKAYEQYMNEKRNNDAEIY